MKHKELIYSAITLTSVAHLQGAIVHFPANASGLTLEGGGLSVTAASGTGNSDIVSISTIADFTTTSYTPAASSTGINAWSMVNNNQSDTHTFTVDDASTMNITHVHIWGLLRTLDFNEMFTVSSSSTGTSSTTSSVTGPGVIGSSNADQGQFTIKFDSPVTSFEITENLVSAKGANADTFLIQVSGDFTPVPEPSSTALLGLGSLALMLRRRAQR
jgi:hypothetical protein